MWDIAQKFFIISLSFSTIIFAGNDTAYPVSYEGEVVFNFFADSPQKKASDRAEEATKLLAHAIESKDYDPDASLVSSKTVRGHILIMVRGHLITTVYPKDAQVDGNLSLDEYDQLIKSRLNVLVERELTRQKWQSIALKFFISVILIVSGFFLLRQIKYGFDRIEILMLEKPDIFAKIRIFGTPFFSKHATAGFLAFLIEIVRWLIYLATIIVLGISLLSQFQVTRNFLRDAGRSTLLDLASFLQQITAAIPGLLLGGLILLCLHIGVHAFNLMLDGVNKQKVKFKSIPSHRVPVFKVLVPLVLLAIFLPLVIAIVFHSFDTPVQWLVIGISLIAFIGSVPLITMWLCGAFILWRNEISPGSWVRIGDYLGEISTINAFYINIVPVSGGIIAIPTIKILFAAIRQYSGAPKDKLMLDMVRCNDPISRANKVKQALVDKIEGLSVNLFAIDSDTITLEILFAASSKEVRSFNVNFILEMEKEGVLPEIKRVY